MTQKIAIIDLGTNTFHLLIAETDGQNGYRIIHRDQSAVKIGQGGINQGFITEDGLTRALTALGSFKNTIDLHGVEDIYAFGTSALRSATNNQDVINKIKTVTGIDIRLISGDVEAEYIYKGVRYSLDMGREVSLIVDIGGGSVECILGDNNQVFWKESFEIGAQRLLERFHKHDPITKEEVEILDQHFKTKLMSLFEALQRNRPKVLIGASGTFDTLSDIYCYKHGIQKSDNAPETPLTLEGFYGIYEELIKKNRAERMQIPGMIEMRVEMIVAACCIVRYILSRHTFNRIRVSSYSLKEGVLASFIQSKSTEPSIS